MTFLEKLDLLMKKNGLNKHKLADLSGVPYTTIVGWYQRGYNGISLSVFKKICDYFGITMDSMARDDIEELEYYSPNKKNLHITKEEEYFLKCYRASDDMHKGLAQCAVGADEKGDDEKMA